MSLSTMLESARRRRYDRVRDRRESARRQAVANGKPVRESQTEALEKVAAALFCRDFLNDLDRLLIARKATLWLVWKRKKGQLYVESPELPNGSEVLMEARRNCEIVRACFEGEIGRRIAVLLEQHNVSMLIAWRAGKLVLQAGNTSVSDTHCLRLIEVQNMHRGRYLNESETNHG